VEGKIAVLGNSDFVMPYSALGVDCFAVDDKPDEIVRTAEKIAAEKYIIIIVAENIAIKAQEVFRQLTTKAMPCILVVPFTTESKGFAVESLG
jgi:vacuolar-type H+-ATPase subunit F/Vma7